MCWESNKTPVAKIATEDITCYKLFAKRHIIWETTSDSNIKKMKKVASLWMNYLYVPYNANPEVKLIYYKLDIINLWIINAGYHSYVSSWYTQKYCSPDFVIIECIIPKGTEYYINEKQEIVSSNIIVTDKIVR